eukprot:CAMPEP_0204514662 /NCGR_PEP_ID=MMETSP0661-20131031/2198_1 /ASSEMBLY_ACC=CAM_ASM_000606 /TAXON_ID=109239 /ORGANISM="Alexandrium margalefi, Strain AMGDE01CS-322" /LENGTH=196 /DNA_ID=CAMNT_0051519919 /DNA_START=58 /DNA_END=648 /DNA_ORIENTATION=-
MPAASPSRGPSPVRGGHGYPPRNDPRHEDEAGLPRYPSSGSSSSSSGAKGPPKGLPPTPPGRSSASSASPASRGVASFAAAPRPVSSRSNSPKQTLIRSSAGSAAGDGSAGSAATACPSSGDSDSGQGPPLLAASNCALAAGASRLGRGPTDEWQEAMANLQRDYAEALRRIDDRISNRMSVLKAELDKSRDYAIQ